MDSFLANVSHPDFIATQKLKARSNRVRWDALRHTFRHLTTEIRPNESHMMVLPDEQIYFVKTPSQYKTPEGTKLYRVLYNDVSGPEIPPPTFMKGPRVVYLTQAPQDEERGLKRDRIQFAEESEFKFFNKDSPIREQMSRVSDGFIRTLPPSPTGKSPVKQKYRISPFVVASTQQTFAPSSSTPVSSSNDEEKDSMLTYITSFWRKK